MLNLAQTQKACVDQLAREINQGLMGMVSAILAWALPAFIGGDYSTEHAVRYLRQKPHDERMSLF
jgi:arginase family enzyme